MGIPENLETVRQFYAAGPSDDDTNRLAFADPGIVWHVPGVNRVSGDYEGFDAVFREIGAAMQPLDRWDLEVVDLMANGDHVVATVRISAERYGSRIETRGGHIFRLNDAARIVEAWGLVADQAGLDALLDPP